MGEGDSERSDNLKNPDRDEDRRGRPGSDAERPLEPFGLFGPVVPFVVDGFESETFSVVGPVQRRPEDVDDERLSDLKTGDYSENEREDFPKCGLNFRFRNFSSPRNI